MWPTFHRTGLRPSLRRSLSGSRWLSSLRRWLAGPAQRHPEPLRPAQCACLASCGPPCSPGKVPTAGLAAIYRYRDAGDVRRDLEGLHAAGLIDTTGDGAIQATESGRAVLTEMYKVSADLAGELWAGQEGSLAGLSNLAGRVVDVALVTGGDAYLAMAPPYEPADAASGLLLHTRLSVLRYHRADAHAAAWQAAGLTSAAINQMAAGPVRDTIEAETNRQAGIPYTALDPDERITFLVGLAALPG